MGKVEQIAYAPVHLKYFVQHDEQQNEQGIVVVYAEADRIKPILHEEVEVTKSSLRVLVLCKRLHLPDYMQDSKIIVELGKKLKNNENFTLQDIRLLEEDSQRQAQANMASGYGAGPSRR